MSIENKTLVQRWFSEVWNEGRADAIDEMLADDAAVHGLGPDLHGPAEFKDFHSAYRNAYPDVTIHIDDLVAEDDMVAVRWSASGTHRGDGLGFPATGRRAQFTGMVFVRIKEGKLVEGWNNFDQLGMLLQLGIVSLPSAV
jgi:steroid delta-isomerase-like uncharacterized protein